MTRSSSNKSNIKSWPNMSSNEWLYPPPKFSPEEASYALAARQYQRLKDAEMGRIVVDPATPTDLNFELGIISAKLQSHWSPAVSKWIVESTKHWLADLAPRFGFKLESCAGGCGRLTTSDPMGRFVCISRPCEDRALGENNVQ